jgi:parallel beta-helix repeat protein
VKRIAIVLAGLLLTVAGADQVSARPLRVPGAFPTIQGAVDAATVGDVVTVAAGKYCESVIVSTPGLRIHGAGNGGTILSGTCKAGGYGFHVRGIASGPPVSGVEISGFVVEGFETGIFVENAVQTNIHQNEVRNNLHRDESLPSFAWAQGILLVNASFNDITENWIHGNGHLGVGLRNGSNGNLVRGNRLVDNQAQHSSSFACTIMLWGTTNQGNRIVNNKVRGADGFGIMIGPGAQTGNLVARNRVQGHAWEGIVVMAGSQGNVLLLNNALGNGRDEGANDLGDAGTGNFWQRNRGTCESGNAGCG